MNQTLYQELKAWLKEIFCKHKTKPEEIIKKACHNE
jgi:hypothetical protein